MRFDWRTSLARDGNRVVLSGMPIAMHCHHYNINLQKTLEDSLGDEGVDIICRASEEAAFSGFRGLMSQYGQIKTPKSKLELASLIYQSCGLGVIHLNQVGYQGGRVVSPSSHHVTGWLAKHGLRTSVGCHFTRGWIAGILEVIYDYPLGKFEVEELKCKMMREDACIFQARVR
jgi:hypothetical protein